MWKIDTHEERKVRRVSDKITTVLAIRFHFAHLSSNSEKNFPVKFNKARRVWHDLTLLNISHLGNPLDLVFLSMHSLMWRKFNSPISLSKLWVKGRKSCREIHKETPQMSQFLDCNLIMVSVEKFSRKRFLYGVDDDRRQVKLLHPLIKKRLLTN